MEPKLKNPVGVLFGGLETIKAAAIGKVALLRKTALTTELKGFIVDTCDTVDCGWETGIKPDNGVWVIVERYANQYMSNEGHNKWVDYLKNNPKPELKDINYIYE